MLIWNQQEPPPPVAYEISYGEVDVRLDPHFNARHGRMESANGANTEDRGAQGGDGGARRR